MRIYLLYLLFLLSTNKANAQSQKNPFKVDTALRDTFSFSQHWAYSWEIYRDEHTGKFSSALGEPDLATDTAHLFFTADVHTNVQGGYIIRYCEATSIDGALLLTFADGLPAYASSFELRVKDSVVSFEPHLNFPAPGRRQSAHRTTMQQLTLNRSAFSAGEKLIGFVDVTFREERLTSGEANPTKYWLRGWFSTNITKRE